MLASIQRMNKDPKKNLEGLIQQQVIAWREEAHTKNDLWNVIESMNELEVKFHIWSKRYQKLLICWQNVFAFLLFFNEKKVHIFDKMEFRYQKWSDLKLLLEEPHNAYNIPCYHALPSKFVHVSRLSELGKIWELKQWSEKGKTRNIVWRFDESMKIAIVHDRQICYYQFGSQIQQLTFVDTDLIGKLAKVLKRYVISQVYCALQNLIPLIAENNGTQIIADLEKGQVTYLHNNITHVISMKATCTSFVKFKCDNVEHCFRANDVKSMLIFFA